jgi:CheY-like chemotaxis protein
MPTEDVPEPPLTIVLVDDHLPHAALVRRSLEPHPMAHCLYHVTNGEAALASLCRQGLYADPRPSPRPQVVRLALRLPRLSGLEVLRAMRASRALDTIPVVILTTSTAAEDVTRASAQHANGSLVKPGDFAQCAQRMQACGCSWLGWHDAPVGA